MQYRLIALDLDGTLLTSRKEISPRTRDALRAARARGIVTVIATGRTLQSAQKYSWQIGGGPVVCCNGAGVLDEQGELVAARGIARDPLLRALELCREAGVMAECYTTRGIVLDRPMAHARAYLRWVRPRQGLVRALSGLVSVWHTNRMHPVRNLVRTFEQPGRPPVLKLMVIGEPVSLAPLSARLHQEVPGLEVTSSGRDNLEITSGGVSKASGLSLLGARLKIPREAIIAFGDSENDLEMLRYAGLGVAMGNAVAGIRSAADRVTATCDQDGIAAVVEEMCLT